MSLVARKISYVKRITCCLVLGNEKDLFEREEILVALDCNCVNSKLVALDSSCKNMKEQEQSWTYFYRFWTKPRHLLKFLMSCGRAYAIVVRGFLVSSVTSQYWCGHSSFKY